MLQMELFSFGRRIPLSVRASYRMALVSFLVFMKM